MINLEKGDLDWGRQQTIDLLNGISGLEIPKTFSSYNDYVAYLDNNSVTKTFCQAIEQHGRTKPREYDYKTLYMDYANGSEQPYRFSATVYPGRSEAGDLIPTRFHAYIRGEAPHKIWGVSLPLSPDGNLDSGTYAKNLLNKYSQSRGSVNFAYEAQDILKTAQMMAHVVKSQPIILNLQRIVLGSVASK